MITPNPIDLLIEFGLTRQEAAAYLGLLTDGDLNGYEVAKTLGISRSNAYTALAGLVNKGAAWLIEGNVTRYTAVPGAEFCDNRLRALTQSRDKLLDALPERKTETGSYITIKGAAQILDRLHHLLMGVQKRVYLALHGQVLTAFFDELSELSKRSRKIVIITDARTSRSGRVRKQLGQIQMHAGAVTADQIRVIVDSHHVMTGELTGGAGATCLYSDQKHLVDLFKTAMRNELRLIEMGAEIVEE